MGLVGVGGHNVCTLLPSILHTMTELFVPTAILCCYQMLQKVYCGRELIVHCSSLPHADAARL